LAVSGVPVAGAGTIAALESRRTLVTPEPFAAFIAGRTLLPESVIPAGPGTPIVALNRGRHLGGRHLAARLRPVGSGPAAEPGTVAERARPAVAEPVVARLAVALALLPALPARHPETDAVCLVQSFYAMLIRLADRLGLDVDRPRHLQKVTRTR